MATDGDTDAKPIDPIESVQAYAKARLQHDIPMILLIDEAHTLGDSDLASLLQLVTSLASNPDSLQILLAGLPALTHKIEQNIEPRALADVVYANLPVFDLDQVAQFIYWQIAHARGQIAHAGGQIVHAGGQIVHAGGIGHELFPQAVIGRIFMHTHGIPRLINAVCDHALLATQLSDAKQVSQSIVDEVANELMTYDSALFLDPEKTVEIPVIRTDIQVDTVGTSDPKKIASLTSPEPVKPPDSVILAEIMQPQQQPQQILPDHTLIHGFTKVIDLQQIRQDLMKPRRRWLALAASLVLLMGGTHLIQAVYNYQQDMNDLQQALMQAKMAAVQAVSEQAITEPNPQPISSASTALANHEANTEELSWADKNPSTEKPKEAFVQADAFSNTPVENPAEQNGIRVSLAEKTTLMALGNTQTNRFLNDYAFNAHDLKASMRFGKRYDAVSLFQRHIKNEY